MKPTKSNPIRHASLPMKLAYPYAARNSVVQKLEDGRIKASGVKAQVAIAALRETRFTPVHAYTLDMAAAAFSRFTTDNLFGRGKVEDIEGMGKSLVLCLTRGQIWGLIGGAAMSPTGRAIAGAGKAVRQMKTAMKPFIEGKKPLPEFGITNWIPASKEKGESAYIRARPIALVPSGAETKLILSMHAFPLKKKGESELQGIGCSFVHIPAGLSVLLAMGKHVRAQRHPVLSNHKVVPAHRLMLALQARFEKKVFGLGMSRRTISTGIEVIRVGIAFMAEHRPSVFRINGGLDFKGFKRFLASVTASYRQALLRTFPVEALPKKWILPSVSKAGVSKLGARGCRVMVARHMGSREHPKQVVQNDSPKGPSVTMASLMRPASALGSSG